MTEEQRKFLDRINEYAEKVLADIDPQKTRISFQLEKLKPVMEEIASETGRSLEDVFIEYMDLASTDAAAKELKLQSELGNL
ncbi:MAG: hypothetical protein IJ485_06225 [Lachnospiraceae bacterium]|nr:hypothetical protein [Lachnospiraceae bacterium]